MAKIKNILIYLGIAVILILIYVFFIKKDPVQDPLVSTSPDGTVPLAATTSGEDPLVTRSFLSLLLNVKNIKLDNAIFSDTAFVSLHDSSIVLTPDGTEGRPNPFAPVGSDGVSVPATSLPSTPPVVSTPPTIPPATPAKPATSPKTPVTP